MRTELREGEKLVLEVKKHWVAILDSVLLVVIAVVFMTGTFIYPEIERLGGLALAAVVAASEPARAARSNRDWICARKVRRDEAAT